MVPRIAMMKALQRESTAASAPRRNAPRPTRSFVDARARAASAPDVRSTHRTGHTEPNAPRARCAVRVAPMTETIAVRATVIGGTSLRHLIDPVGTKADASDWAIWVRN